MTPFVAGLLVVQIATVAVDDAVRSGIEAGVFPGAVVVVGTGDTVLLARGYGHFTWEETSAVPRPDSTLYDLASLTKVVATTPAAMILADRGRLALRSPVMTHLPDFRGPDKQAVTVRHLLEHRSGLRAFLPLHTLARDPAEARRLVVSEPLRWRAGERVEYSDLNAMLLGWVVEAAAGLPLDRFAAAEVFVPLGMTETRYRPSASLRSRIAPVGRWRGHAIGGEVHDQNAARLGGVAGHAGLYSTGLDLARYARLLLRDGIAPDGNRLIRRGTVQLFTRRAAGNRALGWAMRDTTTTDNTGALLSAAAYGHTGFTGTAMWLDPERDLFVILLTNRVFAPRTQGSIASLKRIRGEVADAAVRLVERWRAGGAAAQEE